MRERWALVVQLHLAVVSFCCAVLEVKQLVLQICPGLSEGYVKEPNGHLYGVKELAVLIDCPLKREMEEVEMTRLAVVEKVQKLECSRQLQGEAHAVELEEMVKLQALVLEDDDCQFE